MMIDSQTSQIIESLDIEYDQMGEEVEEEKKLLENPLINYHCKKCRQLLFDQNDIIPHQQLSQQIPSMRTADERTHCEIVFIREVDTLLTPRPKIEEDEDQISDSLAVTAPRRLECGSCHFKLGRCAPVSLVCSCGGFAPLTSVSPTGYYFAVSLSRVDGVLPNADYSVPRNLSRAVESLEACRVEAEKASENSKKLQKEQQKLKREKKRNKKQQRENQRGNFTEFRNKSTVQPHNRMDPQQ